MPGLRVDPANPVEAPDQAGHIYEGGELTTRGHPPTQLDGLGGVGPISTSTVMAASIPGTSGPRGPGGRREHLQSATPGTDPPPRQRGVTSSIEDDGLGETLSVPPALVHERGYPAHQIHQIHPVCGRRATHAVIYANPTLVTAALAANPTNSNRKHSGQPYRSQQASDPVEPVSSPRAIRGCPLSAGWAHLIDSSTLW